MKTSRPLDGLAEFRQFVLFLGRDTTGTLAAKSFPAWMRLFDADCELVCINMSPDSGDQEYVSLLARVRDLKGCAGMMVTSHKVRLYQAAHTSFDRSSSDVELLEEVGGVVVSDKRVVAVSPDAAGFRDEFRQHVNTTSAVDIIVLGGGGASRAIALVASALPNVRRIAVTEIDSRRRSELQRWVAWLRIRGVNKPIDILPAEANNELTSNAAPGALVVNASGLGKDSAGSPISRKVKFPFGSIVWDLNYRGELTFLDHANDQADKRDLFVMDGFSLFVKNWTWLLECALGKKLNDQARKMLWQTTQLTRNED